MGVKNMQANYNLTPGKYPKEYIQHASKKFLITVGIFVCPRDKITL